jgi:hypothetical protein
MIPGRDPFHARSIIVLQFADIVQVVLLPQLERMCSGKKFDMLGSGVGCYCCTEYEEVEFANVGEMRT